MSLKIIRGGLWLIYLPLLAHGVHFITAWPASVNKSIKFHLFIVNRKVNLESRSDVDSKLLIMYGFLLILHSVYTSGSGVDVHFLHPMTAHSPGSHLSFILYSFSYVLLQLSLISLAHFNISLLLSLLPSRMLFLTQVRLFRIFPNLWTVQSITHQNTGGCRLSSVD